MREFRRSGDCDEQGLLAFSRANFDQINVEIRDGIPLEALLSQLVAAGFEQARDAVALWAPMQSHAAQIWDVRLQRVAAIFQRQRSVAAKRGR
jgi:hypothetical protein